MTIEDRIISNAALFSEKTALIINGVEYSYKDLFCYIEKAEKYLSSYKINRQERVVLLCERSIHYIACYFALHRLDLIVVPIDEKASVQTFASVCRNVCPVLVIGSATTRGCGYRLVSYQAIFDGCHGAESAEDYSCSMSFHSDDIADIMFTSGTTGTPKGVVLTHKNLFTSTVSISDSIGNSSYDIEVLALPISHSFGMGRLRSALYVGSTVILYNGFTDIKGLFSAIEKYRATGFSMVPAAWRIISKLSGKRIAQFSSQLRYIEMGSARLSLEEKQELLALFPTTKLKMHYGLTEASRSLFMEFHTEPLCSIGMPVKNVSVKIFDGNNKELKEGEIGEICVKGPHVTKGYYGDPAATEAAFVGDYFKTGDLGYMKSGYYYLTGRLKDMINVGGEKVSAAEVEETALTYPGVSECACIGIEDSILGEHLKLFVVTSTGDVSIDSLRIFLSERLESYKIPQEYQVIGSLPRTENGKIKKYLLH